MDRYAHEVKHIVCPENQSGPWDFNLTDVHLTRAMVFNRAVVKIRASKFVFVVRSRVWHRTLARSTATEELYFVQVQH